MEKYCLCLLSVVPVRKENTDTSEIVTQLIFGDLVQIVQSSKDKKWLEIESVDDQYRGWIDPKQVLELTDLEHLNYIREKAPIVIEKPAYLHRGNSILMLSVGSRLPFFEKGYLNTSKGKWRFDGQAGFYDKTDVGRVAGLFLGVPYLWGGKSQFGIDCSGFVQLVMKMCGKQLLRDASQQVKQGDSVDYEDIKSGDLVFFKNATGKIIHVGIMLQQGNVIHAHGEVRVDVLHEKGIYNTEQQYYSHEYACARRIF